MKIYKVYKSDDPLNEKEKYILNESNAKEYLDKLMIENMLALEGCRLSEKEFTEQIGEVKEVYGKQATYSIDTKSNIILCEYVNKVSGRKTLTGIAFHKYKDFEDNYESLCSTLFYIEEITVED